MRRPNRKTELRCIACKKPIEGKSRVMMLKITSDEDRFVEKAKKLGFASTSWHTGDYMKGVFHENCFETTILTWEVAFQTRPVGPRR